MKNNKTLIIAGTSLIILTVLFLAYQKKKNDDENDILNDAEFQELLKKVDNAIK